MSKNVNIDGKEFSGISKVKLNTTDGGTALFKDIDEIVTPSGALEIIANGTYDVTDKESVIVSVPSNGGDGLNINGAAATYGTFTVAEDATQNTVTVEHGLNAVPSAILIYRDDVDFSALSDTSNYVGLIGIYACGTGFMYGSYNGKYGYKTNSVFTVSATNFTIGANNLNSICAGIFKWVAIS